MLEEIIRVAKPAQVFMSIGGVREGLLFERLDEDVRKRDPCWKRRGSSTFCVPARPTWRRSRRMDRPVHSFDPFGRNAGGEASASCRLPDMAT